MALGGAHFFHPLSGSAWRLIGLKLWGVYETSQVISRRVKITTNISMSHTPLVLEKGKKGTGSGWHPPGFLGELRGEANQGGVQDNGRLVGMSQEFEGTWGGGSGTMWGKDLAITLHPLEYHLCTPQQIGDSSDEGKPSTKDGKTISYRDFIWGVLVNLQSSRGIDYVWIWTCDLLQNIAESWNPKATIILNFRNCAMRGAGKKQILKTEKQMDDFIFT